MSNMTKHFKAKAKRGLCLADGFVGMSAGEQGYINDANKRLGEMNGQTSQPKQQPYGAGVNGIDGMSIGGGQYYGDLKNMDRLTAGQYTNDPDILNAAMDREGPKRYLDYSPQPVQMANKMADSMPVAPQKRPAPRITAFDEALQPTGLRQGSAPTGFADGMVPETADQLMARMAQKYGTTGATPQMAAPQPAPVQPPVQQAPKPQSGGLLGNALRGLRGAGDQLRQVANYKDGMVHEGPGIVHGPGGPKEDKVDAKLSDGEAVLPAATVEYLGGAEEVAHLIEMTNGKAPARGLREGVKAAGGLIDGWGLGRSPAPTIHGNGGLPAPVVQAGIDTMKGQLAEQPNPQTQIPAETIKQNIVTLRDQSTIPDPDRPTDPSTDGRRTYSSETAPAFVNRSAAPVAAAKPVAPYRNEGGSVPNQITAANPSVVSLRDRTLVDNTLGKDARSPDMTNVWAGNDPMKAQQYVSDVNAAKGLRNNPANGHGVVSINQSGGKVKNVLMGPSGYTAADGSKTSDWTKTTQFAEGTAQAAKDKASLRQLQYENAKFNATSDQIKDPRAQAAGLRALAQYDIEEKQKAETAKASELAGLRRDANAINREQLSENARQFNVGQSEKRLLAQAASREKGVKDLDTLIEGQGVDDPKEFRDFMRNNFFGRKHLIDGKEVDVPGMEDMSSDQMRALMPTALMQHRFNKEFNAASSTGTSKNAPKKLRERATNYSDVEKNAFGIPSFGTSDNKNKLTLAELLNSKLPDGIRQINPMMLEEYDPATGGVIRKARKGLLAGQPDQSIDRAAYVNSLKQALN